MRSLQIQQWKGAFLSAHPLFIPSNYLQFYVSYLIVDNPLFLTAILHIISVFLFLGVNLVNCCFRVIFHLFNSKVKHSLRVQYIRLWHLFHCLAPKLAIT